MVAERQLRGTSVEGVLVATGGRAPVSGWWRPDGDPAPFRYVPEGALLPALEDHPVLWLLVYALPSGRKVGQGHLQHPDDPTYPRQGNLWEES